MTVLAHLIRVVVLGYFRKGIQSMKTRFCWQVALLFAVLVSNSFAAGDESTTTITVERMCETCAKKIVVKLKKMPEVTNVKTDLKAKTISVTPKSNKTLSPKLLWETVEGGGERPVKLEGPGGTYTTKPKS